MMVLTKMGDLMGVHVRTLQLCFVYDLEDLALGFHITEILLCIAVEVLYYWML